MHYTSVYYLLVDVAFEWLREKLMILYAGRKIRHTGSPSDDGLEN